MNLSVIIPALNEAAVLKGAFLSVGEGVEVIVADGGSTDGTVELALSLGARVIRADRGRGAQMDAGALASTGGALLFLHADSTLPPGWAGAVTKALGERGVAGGAFRLAIGSGKRRFRVIERAVALRCRALGLIYGDQALFVKREVFFRAGGFNKLPLMEDVDCVKRLRRHGRIVLLDKPVTTSPRRWERKGALAVTLKNLAILSLYFAGVPPGRL
ncbi:MAG: TIGR04283 family arsenosugar biosynthesis glycosyltransferase, partial [Deltaproteobacteria bacterium]|nr:TIGR04283 family arsenosugar biosynthesis glycosyltransferase [Deltaproteobacteria bacterium]